MEKIRMNKFSNQSISEQTCEIYKNMYLFLFKEISKAIELLNNNAPKAVDNAINILKYAQCETENIFMNFEQSEETSIYSEVPKRVNLQSLGYFIKEESTLNDIHRSSFSQREQDAEHKLYDELHEFLDIETTDKIYSAIIPYTSIKEEIQLSLGMKIGAKLALLLTDNSEYDF